MGAPDAAQRGTVAFQIRAGRYSGSSATRSKTMAPSFNHFRSRTSSWFFAVTARGSVAPEAGTTQIVVDPQNCKSGRTFFGRGSKVTKAIIVPSGDGTGSPAAPATRISESVVPSGVAIRTADF